jgi:hypothetical protein
VWSLRILLIRTSKLEITTFNKFRTHHNFTEKRSHFGTPVKQAKKLSHGFRTCLSRRAASNYESNSHWHQRKKFPPISKEKSEELFRALNTILDAITSLNLRELEAEAAADRGETSVHGAAASSKGKDKVPNLDWEDVPSQPIPITPLSSRPKFSQVVGDSVQETPIRTPSTVAVAALAAMANGDGGLAQAGENPPQVP